MVTDQRHQDQEHKQLLGRWLEPDSESGESKNVLQFRMMEQDDQEEDEEDAYEGK